MIIIIIIIFNYFHRTSLQNFYGLASLHQFVYEVYLSQQKELQIMLQSIQETKQKKL